MTLNTGKTSIISSTRKTNSIGFSYKWCKSLASRAQCVKTRVILLDFELLTACILSQTLIMLGLDTAYITFPIPSNDILVPYS
jgi:hypothetical protein